MIIRSHAAGVFIVLSSLAASPAAAQVPMTGHFLAEARCPGLASLAEPANPGTISTEPGENYRLVGRNSNPTTHYFIEIPNAEPMRRWVAIGCGIVEPEAGSGQTGRA